MISPSWYPSLAPIINQPIKEYTTSRKAKPIAVAMMAIKGRKAVNSEEKRTRKAIKNIARNAQR
jgi:hypothetical protein